MMVTLFIRAFCAVSDRRSIQPDSVNRFPSISIPIKEHTEGSSREMKMVVTMGNTTFSKWVTVRSWAILIFRSSLEVNSFITGGWIRGTRDM